MTNYDTLLPSTYGAGTYMAGASTEYSTSYRTWMAFNKTLASGWASTTAYNTSGVYTGSYTTLDTNGVVYYGEWLQLQLPVGIILNSYALCGGANAYEFPKSWYILGSVDGNNWTLVDTQTNITTISSTVYRFFTVSNLTRTFNFYRMVTNTTQGGAGGASDVYILEWRLFTNMTTFQNRYPKYKGTIPYYTSQNSYGLGQYQIWANTIQDYSFSNQAVPSGLFTKTVGNTSNTVWASYSNVYTRTVDTVSSNLPIIYAQFPDLIQLNYYSITARGGNALETPSKWTLFGSNTAISSSWQTVDSESDITYWSAFQTSNFPVSGSNAYNFYKMELYRNSSLVPTRMSMGELRFFGSKQTPEPCLVVATNGFVGFGTTNPVSSLDIQGDLYLSGNLCNSLMRIGPNVTFDGSSNNRDTFLRWMQYVTSTDYRFALQPRRLASSTWWNAGNSVTLYDGYTYSTIATGLTLNAGSYVGATLMMDGRVLLNPFNATTIGLFDPSNNSYTSATTHLTVGQTSFIGSVLLPNGKVVCVPYGSTTIGIFNPSTNLFSTISIGGTGLYAGGVLLPDGRVIFVQTSSSYIGFFNPSTNVYTSYNTGLTGTNLFEGGVLLPDGRVVMVPRNATYIGIYNSITNTYTTTAVGNLPGSTAYSGGIHLPDGRILFAPCSATTIGLFNPYTNTFSTILGAPGSTAFFGGVLLPDGRVIFVPHSAAYVGVFNPFTNTYTTMLSAPGSSAYVGGRTLPDGRIILVPYYATTVGILTPTQIPRPPPLELCYHPCFNKY
jgi:streptogramin lyase